MRLLDYLHFTDSRGSMKLSDLRYTYNFVHRALLCPEKGRHCQHIGTIFLCFEFRAVLVLLLSFWFAITHLDKSGLDCHSLGKLFMDSAQI